MKIFLSITTALLAVAMGPLAAEQSDRRVIVTVPANDVPITVSSDSKIVQDFLRKHKAQKAKYKADKKGPGQANRAAVQKGQRPAASKQPSTDEPIIVRLEGAENQPPVVNKTKQFMFKDVTQRSATVVAQPDDLAKRTRNIELLRQQAARR